MQDNYVAVTCRLLLHDNGIAVVGQGAARHETYRFARGDSIIVRFAGADGRQNTVFCGTVRIAECIAVKGRLSIWRIGIGGMDIF